MSLGSTFARFTLWRRLAVGVPPFGPIGIPKFCLPAPRNYQFAPFLHLYNELRRIMVSLLTRLLCSVCFDTISATSESDDLRSLHCLGLNGEPHATCGSCISTWAKTQLQSNDLSFRCPDFECNRFLSEEEVKDAIGTDLYAKMEDMKFTQSVERNPLSRWCPSPHCGAVVRLKSANTRRAECATCSTKFCTSCYGSYERGHMFRCRGEADDVLNWTRGSSDHASRPASRRCPTCRTRIQKDGGCNHVVCWSCRSEWCFLCLRPYESNHYTDPFSGCPGMLHAKRNWWGNSTPTRVATKGIGIVAAVGFGVVAVGVGLAVVVVAAVPLGVDAALRRRNKSHT